MRQIVKGILAWRPPVGVFIAMLALLGVLVPIFRDLAKIGAREKALWTTGMFSLVWLEIRSIYLDRAAHDRQEADARAAQLEGFKSIAKGINETSTQNQQQFAATVKSFEEVMRGVQDSINTITGGDSFAYLTFMYLQHQMAHLCFHHGGKYPLYGVTAKIVDLNKMKEMIANKEPFTMPLRCDIIMPVGDISANAARPMGMITFTGVDRQDYNVFFYGRNGFWSQLIRLRWIDNRWISATRVLAADGRTVLYEDVGPAFPRANDEVDWG